MELIERYLQTIGRALPEKQRTDILSELRSSLYDALEERSDGTSDEETAVAIIKEMGSPQKVAASYYPAGQYLIGPALYPLFQTILQLVFTVVVVVQLVGIGLSVIASTNISILDEVGGLGASLTGALGSVVVIFWLLQRMEVQPEPEAAFDPRKLPALEKGFEPVSRTEQIISIVASVAGLVFLSRFAVAGGFAWVDGRGFFENPVIAQYFPWIVIAALIGVALDIVLLWRGRWEVSTRVATILSNLFSLGVLYFLIQGHNAFLDAAGVPGMFQDLSAAIDGMILRDPMAGMVVFRAGLSITALVVLVETATQLYRLIWPRIGGGTAPKIGVMSVQR